MKKYPHIKIDLVSTGTSSDHYTKFQNVVKAGSGIPDIVQTDYDSMPQYAATGSLANISEESIEKEFGSLYADAAWNAVHMGDGLYGIPSDQAPVAMYVRADILEEYGIDVPTHGTSSRKPARSCTRRTRQNTWDLRHQQCTFHGLLLPRGKRQNLFR